MNKENLSSFNIFYFMFLENGFTLYIHFYQINNETKLWILLLKQKT